ncbi:MAG: hypothetical protein K6A67_11335 [Bacteroidales bacterium]|nr:hypothetical protein [Bacteroidales bacterium]
MTKKIEKILKEANKELKSRKFLNSYQIEIGGDFSNEYNEVRLTSPDGHHKFPIANAETEGEAIAVIKAYISGFSHGKEKSYVRFCDEAA